MVYPFEGVRPKTDFKSSKDLQDNGERTFQKVTKKKKKTKGVIHFKTPVQVSVTRDTNKIFQIYGLLAYRKFEFGGPINFNTQSHLCNLHSIKKQPFHYFPKHSLRFTVRHNTLPQPDSIPW